MNNKDLKMEQQPNNELKDDGLPEAIACTKPNVVRRYFGSQKMWVCVSPKGRVDHWSIRYSRKDSINEFVKSYNSDKYQWDYFKTQGWVCVKVKIDYEQLNVKQ
jgi:hypothetical protein